MAQIVIATWNKGLVEAPALDVVAVPVADVGIRDSHCRRCDVYCQSTAGQGKVVRDLGEKTEINC